MAESAKKATEDQLLGTVIAGEFLIEKRLGAGGMGAVYRAVQQGAERNVAVKVLHQHLYDETLFKRFKLEAQIISKLNHPNIITVFKCGQDAADGRLYIAMEYLEGQNLESVLENTRGLEVDRALPLMVQMADALAYAHDQKIVHRDIKPENIILTRTGRNESVKVLDFGIAKMLDGNAALTRTGSIFGTPMFMSPEQWMQVRDIDGRTDLYSLGCVFYMMVTGRHPHVADSVMGYMQAHTTLTPVAPIDASQTLGVLPVLSDVIMRCMAREREDRYPDAYALVEALKEAQLTLASARRANTAVPVRPVGPPSVAPGPGSATGQRPGGNLASRVDALMAQPEFGQSAVGLTIPGLKGPKSVPPPVNPATREQEPENPTKKNDAVSSSGMVLKSPSSTSPLVVADDSGPRESIFPTQRVPPPKRREPAPEEPKGPKVNLALVGVGLVIWILLGLAVALR